MESIISRAERLFRVAARRWEWGNNGIDLHTGKQLPHDQKADNLEKCETECVRLQAQAERLLTPLGIEIDYPGLYPSFKVGGYGYHDVASAVAAATGQK